jgi:hypothetical protein
MGIAMTRLILVSLAAVPFALAQGNAEKCGGGFCLAAVLVSREHGLRPGSGTYRSPHIRGGRAVAFTNEALIRGKSGLTAESRPKLYATRLLGTPILDV